MDTYRYYVVYQGEEPGAEFTGRSVFIATRPIRTFSDIEEVEQLLLEDARVIDVRPNITHVFLLSWVLIEPEDGGEK